MIFVMIKWSPNFYNSLVILWRSLCKSFNPIARYVQLKQILEVKRRINEWNKLNGKKGTVVILEEVQKNIQKQDNFSI